MADIVFVFVLMIVSAAVIAIFMFIASAYYSAILETKEQIAAAEHIAELKNKEALEKFLRGYEVEGRTMEEWFALIKKWEGENGTERTDKTSPDR